ncbi:hypothetical protein LL06_04185 [Hoeflea sp. BAL378]|uniref:hypothetical protein n=1 Tax=Hoeflea sp. BAL378 TaxID=1547437 RepID=UPI000514577B|nr:hypothetical protein [Hoeflea sp. BAL378]KGF70571.1 hypothetical protein LL06_04185 [Hoeflea sp. BAL378]
MIRSRLTLASLVLGLLLAGPAQAQDAAPAAAEAAPPSTEEGLANWQVFYEVASHPRCANCHTGPDNWPMWSGPSYGEPRRHGMNINAGDSRVGAEALMCSTCHVTLSDAGSEPDPLPHAAPRAATPWMLAPVETEWFGKSSVEICNQIKDPARNGERTIEEVAEHVGEGAFQTWAWNPGGGREPAPHSKTQAIDALLTWAAAGAPCPEE